MRKLLIVSYMYPPVQAIGAVRINSFVRHLPKFGWQPYVLTVRPGTWAPADSPVPVGESADKVCRTRSLDVSRWVSRFFGRTFRGGGVTRAEAAGRPGFPFLKLCLAVYDGALAFPDAAWPWRFLGRREALEFSRRVGPDAILSSSVPFTSHLVASRIQRRLKVPWVAEFRDLWSQNFLLDYPASNRRARRRLEVAALRNASALCTISDSHARDLQKLHEKPVFVVANGFEPEEFSGPAVPFDKFTILYTGMLYPGKRDPRALFSAIKALSDEGAISSGELRVEFYGLNHDVTRRMAEDWGIGSFVATHGLVPRAESLRLQKRAHLLLLLEWPDPRAEGGIPGKLFEYLGARRPILAIGPSGGAVDRILRATRSGQVYSEVEEIKERLRRLLEAHRNGRPLTVDGDEEEVLQYTRERQAGILADNLSRIAGSSS